MTQQVTVYDVVGTAHVFNRQDITVRPLDNGNLTLFDSDRCVFAEFREGCWSWWHKEVLADSNE